MECPQAWLPKSDLKATTLENCRLIAPGFSSYKFIALDVQSTDLLFWVYSTNIQHQELWCDRSHHTQPELGANKVPSLTTTPSSTYTNNASVLGFRWPTEAESWFPLKTPHHHHHNCYPSLIFLGLIQEIRQSDEGTELRGWPLGQVSNPRKGQNRDFQTQR